MHFINTYKLENQSKVSNFLDFCCTPATTLLGGKVVDFIQGEVRSNAAKYVRVALTISLLATLVISSTYANGAYLLPTSLVISSVIILPLLARSIFRKLSSERLPTLEETAGKGHIKIVKVLIEIGADVNLKGTDGRIPLSFACANEHLETASLLIEKGSNVNTSDNFGRTPLSWTAERGNLEIAKLLIEKGAEDNYSKNYLLSVAANNGDLEMANLLIKNGFNVNTSDNFGPSPLWWVAKRGNLKIANLLIESGAEVNYSKYFPLLVAAENGHLEIANLLIENGAKVNITSNSMKTPLSVAAENGHLEIVRLLFERGAHFDASDH